MPVSFKFPLGCHCSVSVVFPWKPFGLSCFPLVFSPFFFTSPFGIPYCQVWTPLEERYHGALVIFNQNKSPDSYPAQTKGKLKPNPSGWKENNRPALAAGVTVYISPWYMCQPAVQKETVLGWFGFVDFLGLIFIFLLAFGLVVLICLCLPCFIRFPLCYTTMSWFRLFFFFWLYSVRDYVCDLCYVSNLTRLGGPLLFFFLLLIFHTFQVLGLHCSSAVHEYSHMAPLGSITDQSHQLTELFKKGQKKKQCS